MIIVKWYAMLVALEVFRLADLGYPTKGHTHYPLDGTFGQACVSLAQRCFDDDFECQQALDGI